MKLRNWILPFLFIGAAGYLIWLQAFYLRPCARPVEYAIGSIDPKFGLSAVEFLESVRKAENLWEKEAGKELFSYNPASSFKINLIYDERQRSIILKQREEFGLEAAENSLRQMDTSLTFMRNEYERRAAAYEADSTALARDQAAYEREVEKWNSRGGAPPAQFESLENERLRLNSEIQRLNSEASVLNQKQNQINTLLNSRNEAAKSYNKLVESYNAKYSSGLEFDQAEYTGKAINIYEFKNETDLDLVLAHELGHALGLDHVDNSKSVMYYLSGGQDGLVLSQEDLAEIKSVCDK